MIKDDLFEAIGKNLPQMVGDELCLQLSRLDALETEHSRVQAQFDSATKRCDEWAKKYAELSNECEALRALKLHAEELDKRELSLSNKLLENQLNTVVGQQQQFMNLMQIVFKNPVFKETHAFSRTVPVVAGGYTTQSNEYGSSTNTKEVE